MPPELCLEPFRSQICFLLYLPNFGLSGLASSLLSSFLSLLLVFGSSYFFKERAKYPFSRRFRPRLVVSCHCENTSLGTFFTPQKIQGHRIYLRLINYTIFLTNFQFTFHISLASCSVYVNICELFLLLVFQKIHHKFLLQLGFDVIF